MFRSRVTDDEISNILTPTKKSKIEDNDKDKFTNDKGNTCNDIEAFENKGKVKTEQNKNDNDAENKKKVCPTTWTKIKLCFNNSEQEFMSFIQVEEAGLVMKQIQEAFLRKKLKKLMKKKNEIEVLKRKQKSGGALEKTQVKNFFQFLHCFLNFCIFLQKNKYRVR